MGCLQELLWGTAHCWHDNDWPIPDHLTHNTFCNAFRCQARATKRAAYNKVVVVSRWKHARTPDTVESDANWSARPYTCGCRRIAKRGIISPERSLWQRRWATSCKQSTCIGLRTSQEDEYQQKRGSRLAAALGTRGVSEQPAGESAPSTRVSSEHWLSTHNTTSCREATLSAGLIHVWMRHFLAFAARQAALDSPTRINIIFAEGPHSPLTAEGPHWAKDKLGATEIALGRSLLRHAAGHAAAVVRRNDVRLD